MEAHKGTRWHWNTFDSVFTRNSNLAKTSYMEENKFDSLTRVITCLDVSHRILLPSQMYELEDSRISNKVGRSCIYHLACLYHIPLLIVEL